MNITQIIQRTLWAFGHTILLYNTQTDEVYIQKWGGKAWDTPDTPIKARECLELYFQSYKIHPDDMWQLELIIHLDHLIDDPSKKEGFSLTVRRLENDIPIWYRIDAICCEDYSDENPYVTIFSHDLEKSESAFYDSYSALSQRFHKILRIDFRHNTTFIIKESSVEKNIRMKKTQDTYSSIDSFLDFGYIHRDDIPAFKRHINPQYIQDHFKKGNTEMNFYYRRKIGHLFRWVKIWIIPTTLYSVSNPVFYYFIEDVHKSVLKSMDMEAAKSYAQFFGKFTGNNNTDCYYENLLSVLSGFTQNYIDFYMIDLQRDLYIKYKSISGTSPETIPTVASYTKMSQDYISKYGIAEDYETLQKYSSSEKLRELMRDCLTLEYEFSSIDGRRLKTICQKVESNHGVPVKLICRTVPCDSTDKLIVKTFGNFEAYRSDGSLIRFTRKHSKQLLAYLIDRHGFPVTSKDIVTDILEKPSDDMNAIKYVSTMIRRAIADMESYGYPGIILKEQKSIRINVNAIDCDYYRLLNGDYSSLLNYHNEYMKEYSWAESTNAEIMSIVDK